MSERHNFFLMYDFIRGIILSDQVTGTGISFIDRIFWHSDKPVEMFWEMLGPNPDRDTGYLH
jgi:hypothetical protein